jgi:hypothetical protein
VQIGLRDPARVGRGARWTVSERTACHLATLALTYFIHKTLRGNQWLAYATARFTCHPPIAALIKKKFGSFKRRDGGSVFLESLSIEIKRSRNCLRSLILFRPATIHAMFGASSFNFPVALANLQIQILDL